MIFIKIFQKFGQWVDSCVNIVYGFGFVFEQYLIQFVEKFQEVKEVVRLVREKFQDGGEFISLVLGFVFYQVFLSFFVSVNGFGEEKLFCSQSVDVFGFIECEWLKKMLLEGFVGEVQWEVEFFVLQDSNNKLVGVLWEVNVVVVQWRQQLEV